MPRLTHALIATLLLGGCSAHPDATTERIRTPIAVSYGSECDSGARPALRIDPRWTEQEAQEIRRAAHAWELAVGVELGHLPRAEEPCDVEGVLVEPGCIARSESTSPGLERSYTRGIVVWLPAVPESTALASVAAHEIGHWIGIGEHAPAQGHTMSGHTPLPRVLTATDVQLWADACADEIDATPSIVP